MNRAFPGSHAETSASEARVGLANGLGAYFIWGLVPLYFHMIAGVPPVIVLCHRIAWSVLFLGIVVSFRHEWAGLLPILRERRSLLLLILGAVLIAMNWLIFIYAVSAGHVLQASLGYFINPLLSIALGMVFLREKLRPWQWLAVVIACLAVANLALRGERFPWIAVSLAASFGLYGLVRKKVNINSLHGLLVETVVLLPLALVVLGWPGVSNQSAAELGLLSLSGIITAVPLLMFGAAVRRLKLSTMGFLQYVGPSIQLVVALVFFKEPLDSVKFSSFALCWGAIAIYVVDSLLTHTPQPVSDRPE